MSHATQIFKLIYTYIYAYIKKKIHLFALRTPFKAGNRKNPFWKRQF